MNTFIFMLGLDKGFYVKETASEISAMLDCEEYTTIVVTEQANIDNEIISNEKHLFKDKIIYFEPRS